MSAWFAVADHQQPRRGRQHDRAVAWQLRNEGHLANDVSVTALRDLAPIPLDLGRAVDDDEHLVARVALAHQDATFREVDLVGQHANPLDLALSETREEGDGAQQIELLING